MDSKIINSNQQQKATPIKKAIYATMTISPFIAVGIDAEVTLLAEIVEFNPIIAAGIFIGMSVLSAVCFAIVKINEEKGENSSINSYITLESKFIPEYVKSSGATIPDPVHVN
ncbi:MAG: hypothetical protein sL5_10040 [Candidatus Mesenet longicola]|uniref:Uncharacterized protein n=1 Tax=Candidatus Mesenet longicola TaxID=1892558 RepID=A0A8J3HXC8_9RICK|nr:MAG: hypothetical protein sGL2_02860 [Candidatus Mesenet longicola]GHM60011.1 MAG: hypothetical protein sL5_10040 [Candidatus Mesenet longicola]